MVPLPPPSNCSPPKMVPRLREPTLGSGCPPLRRSIIGSCPPLARNSTATQNRITSRRVVVQSSSSKLVFSTGYVSQRLRDASRTRLAAMRATAITLTKRCRLVLDLKFSPSHSQRQTFYSTGSGRWPPMNEPSDFVVGTAERAASITFPVSCGSLLLPVFFLAERMADFVLASSVHRLSTVGLIRASRSCCAVHQEFGLGSQNLSSTRTED